MTNNQQAIVLKSLILRAWRERWSEVQWSISIKKHILNQDDNKQLAEILIQQMLVGSSPNLLMSSYLKHALSTQMVSFSSAFTNMVKFDDINKPWCINGLLDIINCYIATISMKGTQEDAYDLSHASLSLIHWLIHIVDNGLLKLTEDTADYTAIVEKACMVQDKAIINRELCVLLYVASLDKQDIYDDIRSTCKVIADRTDHLQLSLDLKDQLAQVAKTHERICGIQLDCIGLLDVTTQSLNMSINVYINIEIALNTAGCVKSFAEQVKVIQKTQNIPMPVLYCEIMRSALLGIVEGFKGHNMDDVKWAAFTFLRIPQIIALFEESSTSSNKHNDLKQAVDKLLSFIPLLDLTDVACNFDAIQNLLSEFSRSYSLLSEGQCKKFCTRRSQEAHRPAEFDQAKVTAALLILRAEPTLNSILKTFKGFFPEDNRSHDVDSMKNHDGLLQVLCHIMAGKSFQLILAAGSANGKLQSFIIKLIRMNEFSKTCTSGTESHENARVRAYLFDITFLMLCYIIQTHGIELLSSLTSSGSGMNYSETFFAQWALACLPEDRQYKSLELFGKPDDTKVEQLIKQFTPPGELSTVGICWNDVLHNAPFAVKEILIAWDAGLLKTELVSVMMDQVKTRMCSLSVAVSTYLCSYINVVGSEKQVNARKLLKQLTVPINPDSTNIKYTERSAIMMTVLGEITRKTFPPDNPAVPHNSPYLNPNLPLLPDPLHLNVDVSMIAKLRETFEAIVNKGCVSTDEIRLMEGLLNLGGARWLSDKLVQELLNLNQPEALNKAVGLIFGLFKMDQESLTLALLHHSIPVILESPSLKPSQDTASGSRNLTDPRSRALAKLCVMLLVTLNVTRKSMPEELVEFRRGRKRSRADVSVSDEISIEDLRPSKLRKMAGLMEVLPGQNEQLQKGNGKVKLLNVPALENSRGKTIAEETYAALQDWKCTEVVAAMVFDTTASNTETPVGVVDMNDKVHRTLVSLFGLFGRVLSCADISSKTGFVLAFMEEAVHAGQKFTNFIIPFMPSTMVGDLIKCVPGEFNTDLLLAFCDLDTVEGRKVACTIISQHSRHLSLKTKKSTKTQILKDIKNEPMK